MKKPNIVYFFVDDLGYGDVSCLNSKGKIKTPNFDNLARDGMTFTDAHSSSAVCSPSRYSVLTGRYNWRSTLQKGIVRPFGDSLITSDRLTVPKFLKKHGYHSGLIGKWHLGMGWDFDVTEDLLPQQGKVSESVELESTKEQKDLWKKSFSKPVKGGPITHGFDYSFGVDIPNWPPYCFIENDIPVGTPSEYLPSRLMGDNLASIQGPAMPYWNFEQLLPTFANKADKYISERAQQEEPFFLYLPMTSPHTPLSVNKKWIGKSGLNNLYADLVLETDDVFGRVLKSLDEHGVADNTLVIFTSDNGCAPYIGTDHMEAQGHFSSGEFRGYKSDVWDGGHRIPFIVRWPEVIKEGSTCSELVCLSDLMGTLSDILDEGLPDSAGEDSVSLLSLFKGDAVAVRDHIVHHSWDGKFAIRDQNWKLVLCPGSGGWTLQDQVAAERGLPMVQLYDMDKDPGEKNNLYKKFPDQVKSMVKLLKQLVVNGRSTPGEKQANDAEVDIWKLDTLPNVDVSEWDDY